MLSLFSINLRSRKRCERQTEQVTAIAVHTHSIDLAEPTQGKQRLN